MSLYYEILNKLSKALSSRTISVVAYTAKEAAGNVSMTLPQQQITEFCRGHHIRRLAIFGSVLHGDQRPGSDLDILVGFEAGYTLGFKFFEIEEELSRIIGRKVDLNTPGFLSRYFRDQVLAEAQILYDTPR